MLVCAFAGTDRMRAAYAHAIADRLRFYSYGDSSLLYPGRAWLDHCDSPPQPPPRVRPI